MTDNQLNRRELVAQAAAIAGGAALACRASAQPFNASSIKTLHPRGRVPLSFIIDDSTCLVNMGHFCMPQFAHAWPDRKTYKQPWRDWPREIPDSFVREFGEWCATQGVKGKYSIVPFPACVGWLDRSLPGWSRAELDASLALVRDLMLPNWDIHPEMITHTRVIDLKTGRPMQEANSATMENSYPQSDVSVDHLTEYLVYALRILKSCGFHATESRRQVVSAIASNRNCPSRFTKRCAMCSAANCHTISSTSFPVTKTPNPNWSTSPIGETSRTSR